MKVLFGLALGLCCAISPVPAAAAASVIPAYASIEELHAALDAGELTSEQLVRRYLARIDSVDKVGPRINAMITLNARAVEQARRLDADRAKGAKRRGALYGIPFIVKDNYDTAGIPTSGGSAALEHSIPSSDAFIVKKLLDQGAVLIGKANMSELAASYGRLGYSSAGGLTVNPYNTTRNVSGSSSGSAAAVAADFAAFALGTDTSGSLRGPASVAGLVGFRPTLGLTSRSGVIPLSLTFDTTGVLARRVRDAAIVLEAVRGPDPLDAATAGQPNSGAYLDQLQNSSLQGVRLGVITNFRGANAEVDGIERATLRALETRGAILVPVKLPAEFDSLWRTVLDPVGEAEFKPQFERYLKTLAPTQPKSLAQLIDLSSSAAAGSSTPINPQRLEGLRQADRTLLTDSPIYIRILTQVIPDLRQQLRTLMVKERLAAFVFSTLSCPASPRFDIVDPTYRCRSDDPYRAGYIASAVGFPEITVPVGQDSVRVPVGYSFMGLPYTEGQLLRFADALERALPHLPPPAL